jgi:hypothetical protein
MSQPDSHLILHPVEAPAAELEMVVHVPIGQGKIGKAWSLVLPLQFTRCCASGSFRVVAATPLDEPCKCSTEIRGTEVRVRVWPLQDSAPSAVAVHVIGRARTSPPAWERHSRQQFTTNRRTFGRALP